MHSTTEKMACTWHPAHLLSRSRKVARSMLAATSNLILSVIISRLISFSLHLAKVLLVIQKRIPMDLNAAMNALTVLLLSNVLVAYVGLEFDSGNENVSLCI